MSFTAFCKNALPQHPSPSIAFFPDARVARLINSTKPRTIRSFVRRAGRLTDAQQRAIDSSWPHYGVDFSVTPLDMPTLFGRVAPVVLEIGFGNGDTLAKDAAAAPDKNFLGIEVHQPGVGRLLMQVEKLELKNVRVMCHDAVEVLNSQLGVASLDQINIYFPDPWPKKRHHKRRLIQPAFLQLLHKLMRPGAHLHIATDWQAYAEHIFASVEATALFENALPGSGVEDALHSGTSLREETKFERRGRKLGHGVWDFLYRSR